MEKDLIVIGAGPGGYAAAIRAAQLGAKVSLVEKEHFGGVCLNKGCIPTKSLYRNAELFDNMKRMNEFGINVGSYELDFSKVQERKREVVNNLVTGIEQLLKANGVEVIKGEGRFKDNNTIIVKTENGEEELTAKYIMIATGSKGVFPPIPGLENTGVIDSDELLELTEVPKRLTIIGGGVVGLEFASIFNAMGSEVVVIKRRPNILTKMDGDIGKRLMVLLKKRGMQIHGGVKVTGVEKCEDGLAVKIEGKKGEQVFKSDKVLVSTGRGPNIEGLGLDNISIEYTKKGIEVDNNFKTNIDNIYAIGDVNGKSMLAHAATAQGVFVVEKLFDNSEEEFNAVIPECVFTFPEVAGVGMTEEEAKEQGIDYKASKFMFGANGKALALGETDGFIKVICDKESQIILGVHIMGPHASDLIHEAEVVVSNKLTIKDVKKSVHAHPTLGEVFYEAVLSLNDEAIHSIPKRK
ncbi:dihydrolipoyl dehydrogenase [Hathewaya massiliensis]|uniref:dihydrolipoyl dehydrogenase n=1 Tax=Hathewaya massiliensis TaxID=1964382 RepID=UPI00115B361B|nr:dihydrolipoyl dehydrogenase [Hathewaya massiliensis]